MPETELSKPFVGTNGTPPEAAVTVLSEADALQGRLEMRGDGQLMGTFAGEVHCDGELMIGRDARLQANIQALNVTVAGFVRGNVVATGRLKITSTGRLEGDARVGALVVAEGGVLDLVLALRRRGRVTAAGPAGRPGAAAKG